MATINADEILQNNILMRQRMTLAHLDAAGNPLASTDNQEMLLKILDSTDRVIIANKRIKVDEHANNNAEHTNAMIAAVLRGVHGQQLFEVEVSDVTAGAVPAIDRPLIDEVTIIDGELDIGIATSDYETFSRRYIDDATKQS